MSPMVVLLRLLAVVLLTLAGGVVTPAGLACACSCAPLTTTEALRNASAVFDGEVIAGTPATASGSGDPIAYTIAVTRVYKGSVPARVLVTSAASEASCGVRLSGEVLVFARGSYDALTTTLCSAPNPVDRAKLGTGRTPAPLTPSPVATAVPTPADVTPWWGTPTAWLAGTGVLALVAVVVWMRRR